MPRQSMKRKSSGVQDREVNDRNGSCVENKIKRMDTSLLNEEFSVQLENIKQGFYLNCPPDFLDFYRFCRSVNKEAPLDIFIDAVNLRLVGPFEVLTATNISKVEPGEWSSAYRCFHDPPEFVTLMINDVEHYHIGYFRDSPDAEPSFIARAYQVSTGKLEFSGTNLFFVIKCILQSRKNSKLAKDLLESLEDYASKLGISTTSDLLAFKERKKKWTCETLNGVGLMVDVNEDGVGYRPLPVSYGKLVPYLEAVVNAPTKEIQQSKFEHIDEWITFVQFANDEGDYGEGIELGLSLLAFCPKSQPLESANVLNQRILHLLSVGYELAKMPEFAAVIRKHMKDRRIDPPGLF